MKPFLYKVAEKIYHENPDSLDQVTIVLPGKRPAIFLRRHFAKIIGKSFWEPKFQSISEFVEELSGNQSQDSLSQLFELYRVYLKNLEQFVSDDKLEDNSFDHFVKWAPQALSDFNEIDNYLLDGEIVFTDLKNIKGIDEWSFSLDDWSDEQTEFATFWEKLGTLYKCYREHCLINKFYYSGLLKFDLSSKILSQDIDSNFGKIYFVGLNALSTSEEKIIYSLVDQKRAEILWDADAYYMKNPIHEAGYFLRKFKKKYGGFNWVDNNLDESILERKVQVFETASAIAQVKYAGEILSQLAEEKLNKTAIVLANESLLIPLLHSLPSNIGKVNVTLGYPLIKTPFYNLIQILVKIVRASKKENYRGIYHHDFIELLSHPFSSVLFSNGESVQNVINTLNQGSYIYINKVLLSKLAKTHKVICHFEWILEDETKTYSGIIKNINSLIGVFRKEFSHDKWLTEILFENSIMLNELAELSDKNSFLVSMDSFSHLFKQASVKRQVSFVGEPLQGLQIMGVLESRALDFERVLILGANEGNLPKPRSFNSYIPYELKRIHGLPTHREQDAIFAYYFYRLLQRSKVVSIFYSSESESLGSAEKSRFVTQLEYELDKEKWDIQNQVIQSEIPSHEPNGLSIVTNQQLNKKLLNLLSYGLSPSALNNFIRCPLDFYYKYVLGLREPEKVEEKIDVSTFGSVVHHVLEKLYEEQVGKVLTIAIVEDWMKRSDKATIAAFEELYSKENVSRGSNHIILNVAIRYIKKFLTWEKKEIERFSLEGKTIKILALEEKLESNLDLRDFGLDMKIKLRGSADRVDVVGGKIRIIDYKTGNVKASDVQVKSIEKEFTSLTKDKVRQLLLYCYMYREKYGKSIENIKPAILSLRNLKGGVLSLEVDKSPDLTEEHVCQFKEVMSKTIEQLLEKGSIWRHDEKSKYCDYCEE